MIIKSETYDPDHALEIVEDQRNKAYNTWIEDENGAKVDEQSLKNKWKRGDQAHASRPVNGPLFVGASVVAGIFVLYLIGLWVDH